MKPIRLVQPATILAQQIVQAVLWVPCCNRGDYCQSNSIGIASCYAPDRIFRENRWHAGRGQRNHTPGNCNGGATMYSKLEKQGCYVNLNCALSEVEGACDLLVG
jgi:hypothetical protein